MLGARSNQKYCKGGRCRNAAWVREHPRRRRQRSVIGARLSRAERIAAAELASWFQ